MKVMLNLSADGRVLSAGTYANPPEGAVTVDEALLPADDLSAYRYVDGVFVHDPLPEEPVKEAESQEERIARLEAQNAMLTDCLLEMSEIVYA